MSCKTLRKPDTDKGLGCIPKSSMFSISVVVISTEPEIAQVHTRSWGGKKKLHGPGSRLNYLTPLFVLSFGGISALCELCMKAPHMTSREGEEKRIVCA